MKKIILIAVLGLSLLKTYAEDVDYNYQQIERQINELQTNSSRLSSDVRVLKRQKKAIEVDIDSLQALTQKQAESIKILSEKMAGLSKKQEANIKRFDSELQTTNDNVEQNKSLLSQRTIIGIIAAFLLLVLLVIAIYLLRKRISKGSITIDEVKAAQDKLKEAQVKLQEESIKLDEKLVEVLNKQMPTMAHTSSPNGEPDHSLALKVADELVRIEKNLSNMDASTKGFKPLSKAVQRIKDNFMAYGYEMVEMLGKPYSDGMKASVTFVTDENMKKGEKVITRVVKPQVNYNGVMIQIAQIEVSQSE